jgi:hypothetical protein
VVLVNRVLEPWFGLGLKWEVFMKTTRRYDEHVTIVGAIKMSCTYLFNLLPESGEFKREMHGRNDGMT